MLSLAIFALTCGFVFGLAQFRVTMIVLATAVLFILAVGFGLMAGATPWGTVARGIMIVAGLQIGYVLGLMKTLFYGKARSQTRKPRLGVFRSN
jgi:hypothetical protein